MIRVRRSATAAIFAGFLLLGLARAFADAPPTSDSVENQPIQRDPAALSPSQAAKTANPSSSPNGFDSVRVALALVAVVSLIFLLRGAMRRFYPGAIPHRPTQAMKVLCRFAISPRQYVFLLQVGKRLVVVGDGGTQLNPLCEITSPEEVEAIVAQVREESAASLRKFDLFFGKARKNYTDDAAVAVVESDKLPEDAAPAALAPAADATFDPSHEIIDPSISRTRDELSGLSQKVRDLARQLGRE